MQKHVARFQKITKLVEQLLVEKPSDDEHLSIRLKENDELGARGTLGVDCAFWCRGFEEIIAQTSSPMKSVGIIVCFLWSLHKRSDQF